MIVKCVWMFNISCCFISIMLAYQMYEVDETGWVNPGDFLASEPSLKKPSIDSETCPLPPKVLSIAFTKQLRQTTLWKNRYHDLKKRYHDEKKKQTFCRPEKESTADCLYFKRLTRSILAQRDFRWASSQGYDGYSAEITFSKANLARLLKYTEDNDGNVHDAFEAMENAVVLGSRPLFNGTIVVSFWDYWKEQIPSILQLFALGTCVFVIFILLFHYMRVTFIGTVLYLFILFFILSAVWTWVHELHIAKARKHAEFSNVPNRCLNNVPGFFSYFTETFRTYFSTHDDPCFQYQKSVFVDPWMEVTPAKAVMFTFTRLITEPCEIIASSVGRCIRNLLHEVPVQLWPVVLCLVVLFGLVMLFMTCRYRVRMPFFSLEHGPGTPRHLEDIKLERNEYRLKYENLLKEMSTVNAGGDAPKLELDGEHTPPKISRSALMNFTVDRSPRLQNFRKKAIECRPKRGDRSSQSDLVKANVESSPGSASSKDSDSNETVIETGKVCLEDVELKREVSAEDDSDDFEVISKESEQSKEDS